MPRSSQALLRSLRVLHLYIGVFIAPALCFFAFTGALQTFSLHETTRGSAYQPPRWAMVLGQLHKKQTTVLPPPRPQSQPGERPRSDAPPSGGSRSSDSRQPEPRASVAASAARESSPAAAPARSHHTLPMKIFFLIVSVGLFLSSITGIYMAYRYNNDPRVITALLVAGIVIPISLLFV